MKHELESHLRRWLDAAVIDAATADRIRHFEANEIRPRSRLATILALSFGGLLLGAGILLFVEAHWDKMSPGLRFGAVLLMVATFHAAGAAAANRLPWLQTALHAVGTLSLGAAIYLTGQIFHLQEHWPAALMLWTAGAACGWILLRDWPHAFLTAFLIPAWLAGEWSVATSNTLDEMRPVYEGILGLAIAYLSGVIGGNNSPARRAVAILGAIALVPAVIAVAIRDAQPGLSIAPLSSRTVAWTLAMALPLLAAILSRGRLAWINVLSLAWVLGLGLLARIESEANLPVYAWCGLGALGMVAWGMKERHPLRVNMGIIGFALDVVFFYFSNVMDKLGRSVSLIGLGLILLIGGQSLEKTRRRLLARLASEAPH